MLRPWLLFALAGTSWACGSSRQATTPLPTVTIADSGGAALEETDEGEPPRAIRCVLHKEGWVHRPVELSQKALSRFASVSRGNASLRLDNITGAATLTVEHEGWRLIGDVALSKLDVFMGEPLWLRGAVLPNRTTALSARIARGQIGLEATFDLRPHHVGRDDLQELHVVEPSVACRHMALRPAEEEFTPPLIEGVAIEGRRSWTVSPGAELALGPRSGASLGTLKLQRHVTVHELARAGDRCWVSLSMGVATFAGWLDCRALGTAGHGRLGRSHRTRPPRIRTYTPLVATLHCDKAVSLVAQRDDRSANVGAILSGVTIRASSETATHFVVVAPRTFDAAPDTRFAVAKTTAARDCTVTRPP